MANTIAKAKTYIQDEQSLQKLFRNYAITQDLAKEFKGKGNGTVSIKSVGLSSTTAGDYSKENGLTVIDLNVQFVDKVLSHDKGNSMTIDRLDDEAALSDNIVIAFNRYGRQVMNPTMDADNLKAIATFTGIAGKQDTAATQTTIQDQIDDGLDTLFNNGLSVNASLVMYISTSCARLLKKSLKASGGYKFGEWNNVVDSSVALYGDTLKAKVIEVPNSLMPTKVQFLLVPIDAVDAVVANRSTKLFTEIPGHGDRKLQLDVNFVYDCFVKDDAKTLIYKSYTA